MKRTIEELKKELNEDIRSAYADMKSDPDFQDRMEQELV